MTADDSTGGQGTFHPFDVVSIDLPRYLKLADVPCDLDAEAVYNRLALVGGRKVPWTAEPERRTVGEVHRRLAHWANPAEPRSSVLFWAGHGFSNGQAAQLYVPGDDPGQPDSAIEPEVLAGHIRDECLRRRAPHWAMVVIQACGAGQIARRVWEYLERANATAGLVLVAAGPEQGEGYAGDFLAALRRVLSRPTSNDEEFPLEDFINQLTTEIEDSGGRVRRGRLSGRVGSFLPVRSIGPVSTPVDVYQDLRSALAGLPPDSDVGFVRPGLGVAVGEFGWYFSGRDTDRTTILTWLTATDHGLFVLTGDSGCGKSAILGNVLLHAHPQVRSALDRLGRVDADWPEAADLPTINGALPLTGATLMDAVQRLADAAGVASPTEAGTAERILDVLVERLRTRPVGALTVFADGLDEAAEPGLIAAALRQIAALSGVRIVLGTRPGPGLLDRLGCNEPHVTVVEVDRDGDAAAIEEYVVRRLTAADGPRAALEHNGHDTTSYEHDVAAVARRIAGRGWRQRTRPFLHARLVVREILSDPQLLVPAGRTRLRDLLRLDLDGLFDAALRRMSAATSPGARFVEPFLRALAHSRGLGLPRNEPLWTAAAQALTGAGDGLLTDVDLDEVLVIAGPYVLLDSADGHSVYRLAHNRFRSHLLRGASRTETARAELSITNALLRSARSPLHPYLRRHLSGHAAAAGVAGWAAVASRPDVIDWLDVAAMTADVMAKPNIIGDLPVAVLGTVVTSHLALAGTSADRTGLRRMGSARITGTWTAAQTIAESSAAAAAGRDLPRAAWLPVWARIRRDPPHLTLARQDRPVLALTGLHGLDNRPLLATGSDDGSVRLWHVGAGEVSTPGLPPSTGRVFDLAALAHPGGAALILARDGESVLVWNLDEHAPDVRLGIRSAEVRAVLGLQVPGLGPAVATGDVAGVVRLWNPKTGRTLGTAMTGHIGPVYAVVPVRAAGRTLLGTAGHDGTLRLWDPCNQRLVRRFADTHARPVRALAAANLGGGMTILISGDDGGVVRRWDIATGRPLGEPLEYRCRLSAIGTCGGPATGVLVVCGDERGRLHFWEPVSGSTWGHPVAAHDGAVLRLLTIASGAGFGDVGQPRTHLATAGEDGTVRIWQHAQLLAAAQQPQRPAGESEDSVRADSLQSIHSGGPAVLAALGPGEVVRHWDWSTGEPTTDVEAPDGTADDTSWVLPAPSGRTLRVTTEPGRTFIADPMSGAAKPVAVPGRTYAAALIIGPGDRVRVALAGHDGAVSIVRESGVSWTVERRLLGHTRRVTALAVLTVGDGQRLLISAGEDRTIRVWSSDDDISRHVIPLGARIRAMTASGDEAAIAADDGLVLIRLVPNWSMRGGKGWADHG